MTGEIIIKHKNGWACSNDSRMIIAHNIEKEISDSEYKTYGLINPNCYFEVNGLYEADGTLDIGRVECLFRSGKVKLFFDGIIEERGRKVIIIKLIGELKKFLNKTIERWLGV